MYTSTYKNQQTDYRGSSYTPKQDNPPQQQSKPNHSIDEAINFARHHSLNGVLIGKWLWVKFTEKPAEQVRKLLLDFGFRFSNRRQMWAFDGGISSQPSKGKPWDKYPVHYISGQPVNLEEEPKPRQY